MRRLMLLMAFAYTTLLYAQSAPTIEDMNVSIQQKQHIDTIRKAMTSYVDHAEAKLLAQQDRQRIAWMFD